MAIKINGVTIGDRFYIMEDRKSGLVYEVVDFWEIRSVTTGEIVGRKCMAKGLNTLATNEFEVPFATVIRNRFSQ